MVELVVTTKTGKFRHKTNDFKLVLIDRGLECVYTNELVRVEIDRPPERDPATERPVDN